MTRIAKTNWTCGLSFGKGELKYLESGILIVQYCATTSETTKHLLKNNSVIVIDRFVCLFPSTP